MMNPLLEVNPDTCIVVAGPLLSRSCLHGVPEPVKLTYCSLVLAGLEMVRSDERGRIEELCQANLDSAAEETCKFLKEQGTFESWMACTASLPCNSSHRQSPVLQLLLEMQAHGCRLVYTHYDNILDIAAGMIPILPSNDTHLAQWIDGQLKGFLHIHGHYSDIDSLILYSSAYDTIFTQYNYFTQLKDLFKRRTIILLGHDTDHLNPLLIKMTKVFLLDESNTVKNPPLLISSSSLPPICNSYFLHLHVTKLEEENLHFFIVCGPENSFVIGRTSERHVDKEIIRSQAVLIFSEKQSFRKLGDIIYQLNQSGEIYVRRDALTVLFGNKIMYGNILTYGGSGLHRIWELSVPPGSVLRSKGLVAIGLQNSLMVWVDKKPTNLGQITEVNTFHSLWNNSASAMKSQPRPVTTSISSSTPSVVPTPTVVTIATTSSAGRMVSNTRPLPLAPTISYPIAAYRPVLPILSPPFIPINSLVAPIMGGPTQLSRPLLATGLPYQLYSGIQPSMGASTRTVRMDSTSSRATPDSASLTRERIDSDTKMESVSSSNSGEGGGGGVVDIDTSRDSLSDEEGYSSSVSRSLTTGPPVLLQEIISEKLRENEQEIVCIPNMAYRRVSGGPLGNPLTVISELPERHQRPSVTGTPHSSNSNTGLTGTTSNVPVFIRPIVSQLQVSSSSPIVSTSTSSPQSVPPILSLTPSHTVLPMATPTLQYPFTIPGPYSFLPSLIQQQGVGGVTTAPTIISPQSHEYLLKILQSNKTVASVNAMPSVVPIINATPMAPPIALPSAPPTAILTSVLPQASSTPQTLLHNQHQIIKTSSEQSSSSNYEPNNTSTSTVPQQSLCETLVYRQTGTDNESSSGINDNTAPTEGEEEDDSDSNQSLHLWEFILHLLLTPNHGNIIQWTGENYEFTIINPQELTTAWAMFTSRHNNLMNFNTLLGILRSYSGLGILELVPGKKLTYVFVMDIQRYISIYGQKILALSKE